MATIRDPWATGLAGQGDGDTLAGLADHPQLMALWRLWEQRREGRIMPARRDVSPEILWSWLGHISLINVCQDPLRLQYRLVGTDVVDLSREDPTGHYLDEIMADPTTHPQARGLYRCLLRRRPVFEVVWRFSRDLVSYETWRLNLPLSHDGRMVDMILTGEYLRAMPAMSNFGDTLPLSHYVPTRAAAAPH